MNNVTLLGMPGAGKSTIGVLLAKALGYDFLDTDLLIQNEEGMLLREIIAKKGLEELKNTNIEHEVVGKTSKISSKNVVKFNEYPDNVEVKNFKSVPSYKRMCICIMKNDHLCKYMGFAPTKDEAKKRKMSIEKYKNIMRGRD